MSLALRRAAGQQKARRGVPAGLIAEEA